MPSITLRRYWWVGYAAALVVAGAVTLLVGMLQNWLGTPNLSVLYILAVLSIAVTFGRGPAILLSAGSFLAYNWFFVEPIHSFTVAGAEGWAGLLVFLAVAIITGELASSQRLRTEEAERREREAEVLYDVVRLMSEPDLDLALKAVAGRLLKALDLEAVGIELPETADYSHWVTAGAPESTRSLRASATPAKILARSQPPAEGISDSPARWVRIVRPTTYGTSPQIPPERLRAVSFKSGERLGMVLLLSRPDGPVLGPADERLLSAVASQLGLAVERRELRREATETEILRRTDSLKTGLLNAVSHDLRTPLSSIIASAGSLLQDDVAWTEQERREFAQAIDEEARRLNRIVANLLNLSRINSGNLQPDRGWYDLGALAEEVLGRLRPITAKHRVLTDIQEDLPPVFLDYSEIDQVLSNLVENAAKYAPAGTEIKISVRRELGQFVVEVADEGPGIPREIEARVFEAFSRASGDRGKKGTGLGLAVARGLVEAHGGQIWFQNLANGGAAFCFTLPAE